MSRSNDFINEYKNRIEKYLEDFLSIQNFHPDNPYSDLLTAIRYSVLNGGKRIRPLLVYTSGIALGAKLHQLDAAAAAVELIHCYSLIHDDLPAMDNDDLRRGKPTCHKVFGEATAILAGDALQSLAFELLSDSNQNPISAQQQIQMVQILAKASGIIGMVGGQNLDMQLCSIDNKKLRTNKQDTQNAKMIDTLSSMHQKKTGALIQAALQFGAIAASCQDAKIMSLLQSYSENLGLAFQVQDDILDIEGTADTLGKNPGQDAVNHKQTFVELLGLEAAKTYMTTLYQNALANIHSLTSTAIGMASHKSHNEHGLQSNHNALIELTHFLSQRHS